MTAKNKSSNDPVLALKCGGKKKKKMADGGIKDPASVKAELYSEAGDALGNYLESLITSGITKDADLREEPSKFLEQRDRLTATGNIAKNTAKGAGVGAAIGTLLLPGIGTGTGAAIGAGVAAAASGLKTLFTSKAKKEQRKKDANDWAGAWLGNYVDNTISSGYKSGGEVKGSGTAKSDSITKNVEDGSFIVPAENSEIAMDLGKKYLGWKGAEIADRTYPGTSVKLSNGEVLYTPEEVDILRYHGLDLNRLAPNAEPGNKMSKGGKKIKNYDSALSDYKKQYLESSPEADDDEIKLAFDDFLSDNPDFGIVSPVNNDIESNDVLSDKSSSKFDKLMKFAPEIAGAIQIGIASKANLEAGKMPDINASESLKQLTVETRKDAQYGLEPGTIAAMNNQTEKARRDATNAITTKGGSTEEVMSNLRSVLSTTIDKKYDIELADNAALMEKKKIYYGSKAQLGDQEYDVNKMARQDWLQIQEVNAGLLSAGISNIIGARKLKLELDAMKKIGTRYADISATKD